jgi:uncharacterized protein
MRDLYAFLDVDPTFVPDTGRRHNSSGGMIRNPALRAVWTRTGPIERAPGARGGGQAFASLLAFVVMVIVRSIMNRGGRGGRGRRAGLPGGILPWIIASQLGHRRSGGSFGSFGGGGGGGGFSGFGGGGGFSGGGASGGW